VKTLETTLCLYDEVTQEAAGEYLLSYETLSRYLGISKRTIEDWVLKRKIPFVKAGRHVRFVRSEIQNWLQKGAKNGHCDD